MNERDQGRQQQQHDRCIHVQPLFGTEQQSQSDEGEGRHGLQPVRAPHGGRDQGGRTRAVAGKQGRQTQINDQKQGSVEVNRENHPTVMLGQQGVSEHDLADERQRHGHQVCTHQPRSVAPAGGRTRQRLGHERSMGSRLSITSAGLGCIVFIQPPSPATHRSSHAFR